MMLLVILFGYGLIFGSFINALVWRLHEQGNKRIKSQQQGVKKPRKQVPEDYSILTGRSMCPQCHHTLAARDLVPVLSWLSLRGRCRYCQKPISAQYPLVELLTGVIFAVFYLGWPFSLIGLELVWFVYGLVYLVYFVALALYDFKWFLLPDKLVFPLISLAASEVVVTAVWTESWRNLWLPVVGAGLFFGLFWVLYQVSAGKWIGGGDVKLAAALGFIAGGPLEAMMVLFVASFLGTLVSIPLLMQQKGGLRQHIPFGPYLLAGCFIVMLYGERILSWYNGLILL
ncbi:prepilin peptidase [Candidatus Saccharibacteria bacterium]|nr:MAG: prepilin peptidase [Candidatus Saccharibacteria bacterium]